MNSLILVPTTPFALNRQTILWVSEHTNQQMDRQTARQTWVSKHTNQQTERQTAGQTELRNYYIPR